jgi:glyoxylase-like metal-dependent hydrolase (beta-lactamase superfamily II)
MTAKLTEVHSGIYEIFLPLPMRPTIINVYLIDCHGAWALVDTGMNTADSQATLEDAFSQVGIRIEDLNVLFGTHHHVDHFGASSTIKQRSGATALLHHLEMDRISRILNFGPPSSRPDAVEFFKTHGFPIEKHPPEGMRPAWFGTDMYSPLERPDKFLNDGDLIPVGDRTFEIIWTPGHAPGHCVVYLRKEKVLIVGDHLLPKITPHVGLYPSAPTGNPLGEFIESQLKIQPFDVELVLPAHGAVFHDHRYRANQLIEHHRYREAEMLDLIRKKPKCAFEVASEVFGDEERPIVHVMAATFETLAHLELARIEGRARRVDRDGLALYQAN